MAGIPARSAGQTNENSCRGHGLFLFYAPLVDFCSGLPNRSGQAYSEKEYAALPQQSKRLLFMCLFRILVAEQESIKKRLENHKDYVNN